MTEPDELKMIDDFFTMVFAEDTETLKSLSTQTTHNKSFNSVLFWLQGFFARECNLAGDGQVKLYQ
jgi:hypothetical protein